MSAKPAVQHARKSLLVARLGAMGDIIHTLAAVTRLRQALPNASIGWLVEERWAELLCAKGEPRSGPKTPSRPLVDFVHSVDTKRWRRSPLSAESRQHFFSALQEMRTQHYDLAIDFQGAIKSALLARLSHARSVSGMQNPRESPARLFYARQVPTSGRHVIEHYRSLAEAVVTHWPDQEIDPESLSRADTRIEAMLPRDVGAERSMGQQFGTQEVVLLNPGAGWGAKQWPAERYGAVARALADRDLTPLINYGPGEENLARKVEAASSGKAKPVFCSVGELIALTRRARLFIGGDTGPLHLAAALGVPVVAIFGPTDPSRNGPYSDASVVLRHPASRTSLSHTSAPDAGLLQITADEVLAATFRLLEHNA